MHLHAYTHTHTHTHTNVDIISCTQIISYKGATVYMITYSKVINYLSVSGINTLTTLFGLLWQ